jgi:sugar lactone lactonase YvrE
VKGESMRAASLRTWAAVFVFAFLFRSLPLSLAQSAPPTLTSISPNNATQGATVTVTLLGTGFVGGGTTAAISGTGVTITVTDSPLTTLRSATVRIASGATPGPRNVTVTTSAGTSSPVTFTVNPSAGYTISTVVGQSSIVEGGPAIAQSLSPVQDVARDRQGNLYIAAPNANKVYKITPAGKISTFAGTGDAGPAGDGGPATVAQLNTPRSVVTDALGDVYIADSGNNRIRKVDAAGNITTFAGTGTAAFAGDGGPAILANLSSPSGLGMGASARCKFNEPWCRTPNGRADRISVSDDLYILDSNNVRVRKVDSNGIISTVAGTGSSGFSGDGGLATFAQLGLGVSVLFSSSSVATWTMGKFAVDSHGSPYIPDVQILSGSRVRQLLPNGMIRTIAGSASSGFSGDGDLATSSSLFNAMATAIDASGNLFIADTQNLRVRKIGPDGTINTIAGNGGFGFNGDGPNATVQQLSNPMGLATDPAGNVYIADQFSNRIRQVTPAGAIATVAGNSAVASGDGGPASSATLYRPNGIAFDASGNLFIADSQNGRIRKVDTRGMITTVAGAASFLVSGQQGSDDEGDDDSTDDSEAFASGDGGQAVAAVLGFPYDVAPDANGNLYIVAASRVRKVTPDGLISTIAGTGSSSFSGDNGPAASAVLGTPQGITVGPDGNIYIADTNNNRVRRINLTTGVITTIAGTGTSGTGGDGGPATAAQLSSPKKIAFDGAGNLYIAGGDAILSRVRKVATDGTISTFSTSGSAVATGGGSVFVSGSSALTLTAQIQQIFPDGTTALIAGARPGISGDNGPALMASISPGALAVSPTGEIFFADEFDNVVRKLTPAAAGSAVLSTSRAGIDFRAGGLVSTTLTIVIGGPGGGFNWTASSNVTTPDGGNWLSLSASSGTGDTTITITANPSGLAAGIYSGSVTIRSAQAVNGAVTVPVTMTVLPTSLSWGLLGGAIAASSLSVSGTAGGSNPASTSVTIRNGGVGAPLPFTVVAVTSPAGGTWLSVSPSSASTTATVTVSYNTTGLPPGTYAGTIILTSGQAANPTLNIPVTMTLSRSGSGPTVSSISPISGAWNQTLTVTLGGSGFVAGATTLSVSGTGVTVGQVSVASASSLTAVLTIANNAPEGLRTVTVTTPASPTGAVTFFTVNPFGLPVLTSVSPAGARPGEFLNVTVTGNLFVPGATTLNISGSGVTSITTAVPGNTNTQMSAVFQVAPDAAIGARAITVTTPTGTTAPINFTVLGPPVSTYWTPLGPASQSVGPQRWSGRVVGLAPHPTDPDIIYMAASGGGVWKTSDAGVSWTPLTDDQATLTMGAIAIAPSSPNVIYAGTGEANNSGDSYYGRGILKSTDAGLSWTLLNAGGQFDRHTISRIAVDPTTPDTVYAAVAAGVNSLTGNYGVWKSIDGGQNWINTTAAISTFSFYSDVQIDPINPNVIYTGIGISGNPGGVYKSMNGGSSWSLLPGAPTGSVDGRIAIAVSKSNSQVVYVSIAGSGAAGSSSPGSLFRLLRSDDGGATFNDMTSGAPNYLGNQGVYDTTLIVDPVDPLTVYAGGQATLTSGIIESKDGGATWANVALAGAAGAGIPHTDQHAFAFDGHGKLIVGSDGGVWRLENPSTNNPVWSDINAQINTIEFVGITTHPTDPSTAFGGAQDTGTARYTGLTTWSLVDGGDGGFVKISPTNPNRIYHQRPGSFRRSDDAGSTWATKSGPIASTPQGFYAPFVVDPNNGDHVLFGASQVWETVDGGESWTAISTAGSNGWPSGAIVAAVALTASNPNTVYASIGGGVYATTNHGVQWSQCGNPGFFGNPADLQVDPSNSQTVYAAFNFFTTFGNVYVSTDGCASWRDISGNLPGLPVYTIQLDPRNGTLYVGADDGVYMSADNGASWSRFGSGLPNVRVHQIDLNTNLNLLAAGTYGRGMWEISIGTAAPTLVKPRLGSPRSAKRAGRIIPPPVVIWNVE